MYYLIEHNRTNKKTDCTEYSDYFAAQAACLQKEQHYLLANQNEMEVVVFEANSIEELKRTHSRYFAKKGNTADALMAVGLVGLAVYLLSKK